MAPLSTLVFLTNVWKVTEDARDGVLECIVYSTRPKFDTLFTRVIANPVYTLSGK